MHEEAVWKTFEQNTISHSVAHYLMAIDAIVRKRSECRAADISRLLSVSRNAVSLQLQTLFKQDLAQIDDRRISLTKKGLDAVDHLIAMRRAFRFMLVEFLGVDPDVAEQDSCKVEHLLSPETGAKLLKLVKFIGSNDAHAQEFLASLKQFKSQCSLDQDCPICHSSCVIVT